MIHTPSTPLEPPRLPTVLIVDDLPGNLKVLATLLRPDYQVVAATSGQKALRMVESAPPDLILLDIVMPKMDGFATCERLQSLPAARDIPIIFITVKSDPEDETRGLALGAVDFISKPFSPSVVLARVKTHLALKEARRQALQAAQAKSLFLAHMSHEIRTPLNGILGFADLLAQREREPKARAFLTIIQHSAQHLLAVTNDILDYTRIEADRITLETIPFHLERLLAETTDLFALSAREKGITLTRHNGPDLPVGILGDPNRLRQVLYNLLANAIKFTSRGEVALEVTRLDTTEAPLTLQFAVRDTGIGIPAEAVHRLFQPFTQADASTTRRFGGTGLGLAICARLVQRMGGTLTVQSAPGTGSCFRFTLPCTRSALPVAPPDLLPDALADPPFAHREYRLLVVDDVETNRILLRETLAMLGIHAVVLAGTGQEALEQWQAHPFDLILMDCRMPVMDGLHATRILRQREKAAGRPPTPVIALTASATSEERMQCLASGMDDLLPKPLTLQAISHLLHRLFPEGTPASVALTAPMDRTAFADKCHRLGAERTAQVIHAFLQDMADNLARLQAAVQDGHAARLMGAAHALKGCCGVVYAEKMAQMCQELEEMGKTGTTHGATERLRRLTREAARIQTFLEQTREKPEAAPCKGIDEEQQK